MQIVASRALFNSLPAPLFAALRSTRVFSSDSMFVTTAANCTPRGGSVVRRAAIGGHASTREPPASYRDLQRKRTSSRSHGHRAPCPQAAAADDRVAPTGARTRKRNADAGRAVVDPSAMTPTAEADMNIARARRPLARTGKLVRVPNVAPADDLLLSGIKRASRVTPTKGLKDPVLKERNRSAKQLDALTTALCKPLGEYVKGFPDVERLHPFERALLELTLRDGKYESTLRQVDTARKAMLSMGKQHAARAAKAKGPKEAVAIREEGFAEMESYFKRSKHSIDELKEIAKTLRRLPVAELSTPTVALVGAPNVGKSSLVRVLSSGTPEVCNYPFTTRGIKMGHFFLDERRHIVTDTPGLLWRPDEDRNKIERLAIATLEHLPTCVVFVTDLSGLCGTSVEDQLAIRAELRERFSERRPWMDILSKSKLVPALGGELCPDLEGLWTEDDAAEAASTAKELLTAGAIPVSAEECHGVEELKGLVTRLLVEHRQTLEGEDGFEPFDPGT